MARSSFSYSGRGYSSHGHSTGRSSGHSHSYSAGICLLRDPEVPGGSSCLFPSDPAPMSCYPVFQVAF